MLKYSRYSTLFLHMTTKWSRIVHYVVNCVCFQSYSERGLKTRSGLPRFSQRDGLSAACWGTFYCIFRIHAPQHSLVPLFPVRIVRVARIRACCRRTHLPWGCLNARHWMSFPSDVRCNLISFRDLTRGKKSAVIPAAWFTELWKRTSVREVWGVVKWSFTGFVFSRVVAEGVIAKWQNFIDISMVTI